MIRETIEMQIKRPQQVLKSRSNGPARQRKWSDWSECTVNCVKVRHRFTCDDIIKFEQETRENKSTKVVPTSGSTTERALIKRHQPSNFEELFNGPEDDYADDGDEIEPEKDTDLCDKVDTSKTFEEAPCTGGFCKFPSFFDQVTPATTTPAERNRQLASKHKASSSDKDSKDGDSDGMQSFLRTVPQSTGLLAGNTGKQTAAGRHSDIATQESFTRRPATYHHKGTRTNADLGLAEEHNSPNSSFTAPNKHASGSIWTQSIWPGRQLFGPVASSKSNGGQDGGALNGPLEQYATVASPQAILIQWTILIGSLLAIILLILLILRKLLATAFPSYHWMLAKQMIKNTSDRLGINGSQGARKRSSVGSSRLDNCCRLAPPPHHRCLTGSSHGHIVPAFNCASSGALLLAETTNQSPTSTSTNQIQTHICYSCHHLHQHQKQIRNQMFPLDNNYANGVITCPTTTNSLKNLSAGPMQCIVDLNGRHHLGQESLNEQSCSAGRFNADPDLITPAIDPPSYVYASMTQSSTHSSRRQHYDTINNYSSISLGYDDPVNLVPERDKAYIVPSQLTSTTEPKT